MGIIWDTRMPKRKPGILSTLDLVGLEMDGSLGFTTMNVT